MIFACFDIDVALICPGWRGPRTAKAKRAAFSDGMGWSSLAFLELVLQSREPQNVETSKSHEESLVIIVHGGEKPTV
jgi:hypothetical protein